MIYLLKEFSMSLSKLSIELADITPVLNVILQVRIKLPGSNASYDVPFDLAVCGTRAEETTREKNFVAMHKLIL